MIWCFFLFCSAARLKILTDLLNFDGIPLKNYLPEPLSFMEIKTGFSECSENDSWKPVYTKSFF